MKFRLYASALALLALASCGKTLIGGDTTDGITKFSFSNPVANGVIVGKSINVIVPDGTDLTALVPTIEYSGSSISPVSGVAQDFTDAVTYTVTASDGTLLTYTVHVAYPAVAGTTLTIAGTASTLAGSPYLVDGPYSVARFGHLKGITFLGGFAWVADIQSSGACLRKIDLSTGNVSTVVPIGGFSYPSGVCNDGTNIYIVANGGVYKYVPGGSCTLFASGFNTSEGICCDGTYLYLAEQLNYSIGKISLADATVTTLVTLGNASSPVYVNGVAWIGGEIYATASNTGTLYKINASTGVIDGTIAYAGAESICTDGTDLYAYATQQYAVYKFSPAATTLSVSDRIAGGDWGYVDALGTSAKFDYVEGIAYYNGKVYLTDQESTIRTVDITGVPGTVSTLCGVSHTADGMGSAASFYAPYGLASDGTSLYVADYFGSDVRRVTISTGEVTLIAGVPGMGGAFTDGDPALSCYLGNVNALAVDKVNNKLYVGTSGYLLVLNLNNSTMNKVLGSGQTDGTHTLDWDSYDGICLPGDGYVYVSDNTQNCILKVNPSDNSFTVFAGIFGTSGSTNSTTGTSASFYSPRGLASGGGNLYVADSANGQIRKIALSTGAVTTLCGTTNLSYYASSPAADGAFGTGQLSIPYALVCDAKYLYVADNGGAIRKVRLSDGYLSTVAGRDSPSSGSGYVNGDATTARFSAPQGIATDGTSLFVADTGNNLIRKIQ